MKKIVIIAASIALVSLSACNNETKNENNDAEVSVDLINNNATAAEGVVIVDAENAPEFEFEETVMQFGEISQGEKVKRLFKFTNIGKSNLIISESI